MQNDIIEKSNLIILDTGHKQEYINVFAAVDQLEYFQWFSTYVFIYFHDHNHEILLRRSIVGVELEHLKNDLEHIVSGNCSIPLEFKGQDIGFLWNEHWRKIALAQDAGNLLPTWDWLGSELLFLQCNSNGDQSNNTFLYSDDDNIILQISSCYPWFLKMLHRFKKIRVMMHGFLRIKFFTSR